MKYLPIPVLLLLVHTLHAQYDAILRDPDVIWAAELTLDFAAEPDYIPPAEAGQPFRGNFSVPLKAFNSGPEPYDEPGILLASRLLARCLSAGAPVYSSPEASAPLSAAERAACVRAIAGGGDSISVLDPVTLMPYNKVVENTPDPYSLTFVRVRQLLYYRASTDAFSLYTLAVAPVFRKTFGPDCTGRYVPFWFKWSDPASGKRLKTPRLDDPGIDWARRLTTIDNMPLLDSLRSFKDIRRPVMQQWLRRITNDPGYALLDGFDWAPISPEQRSSVLFRSDTVVTFDPETYEEATKIVRLDVLPEDIVQVKLMQDWYWDERRQRLVARLVAFAPVVEAKDEEGNFRYRKALFWRRVGRR